MVFLAFRTITRGRWRRARWAFLLLVGAAFALYALTAAPYAFPGRSASWIVWALGADVREVPSRPVLALLGHAAAGIPWGPLALRLNLLAALAGALAGASWRGGVLLARILARDAAELRDLLARALLALRGGNLPRIWQG
jgi:hypothetical protein